MASTQHGNLLITNTLWVYLSKVIAQLLGVFATVLVIRKLPVDTYGTYTFLFGLFFVYQLFITSPIKNVLLRYIPELTDNGSYSSIRKLLLISFLFILVLISLFSFLINVFNKEISVFFNLEEFTLHIKAFTVFAVFYAIKIFSDTIIASFIKHKISAQANVLVVIIRASCYLVMLNKITVNILLYVEAIVSIIFVLYVLKTIISELFKRDIIVNKKVEINLFKVRILRFYALAFFSELGYGIIGKTSDHYIIAAMSTPFYVGLYGFAIKIYEMFYKILPFREFEGVLKPIFFKRYSSTDNSDKDVVQFYHLSVKILLPLFILPFVYFLIFGKGVIINVFEEKYLPAYSVTCVSLLGILLNGIFYPLNLVIQLKERVEINLYSRVIIIFSIVAGIYLMDLYGIIGVAIATLLGEFFKNLFMFVLINRYININYAPSVFIKGGGILITTILIFIPFINYFHSIIGLMIGSILFFILYLVLIINVHPFTNYELKRIERLFTNLERTRRVYLKVVPLINLLVIKKNKY